MGDNRITWLDYFSGGVPTGAYFRVTMDSLRQVTDSEPEEVGGIDRLRELCLIGLLAYFEAFCKDHFASLINIEPNLVNNLKTRGQSVTIEATHVVLFGKEIDRRIGFILAEKYDFGTAQKINALFGALLKVTPFNKKETATYNRLLRDRNLFVHHGGTFTLAYLDQLADSKKVQSDAFFHSVVVSKGELIEAIGFIEGVARKLLDASHRALLQHVTHARARYGKERRKALDSIPYWE